jgi:hypothetical protein
LEHQQGGMDDGLQFLFYTAFSSLLFFSLLIMYGWGENGFRYGDGSRWLAAGYF